MRKLFKSSLLILIFASTLSGQKYAFEVQEINVKDGLPHRTIYDIVEDRRGYIWLSYQGGICRYDGYEFKTYSASHLNIGKAPPRLAVDKKNRIWYAEAIGVIAGAFAGVLDQKTGNISTFDELSNGLVSSSEIISIKNAKGNPNDILITTSKGTVFKYDGEKEIFEQIFDVRKTGLNFFYCESFEEGIYWIITDNIIFRKNLNTYETTAYETAFEGKRVEKLIPYDSGFIAEVRGIWVWDREYLILKGDKFVPFNGFKTKFDSSLKYYLYRHSNFDCFRSESEIIVAGHSGNSLFRFTDTLRSEFRMNVLATDEGNSIWLASLNGLFKITAKEIPFETVSSAQGSRLIFENENKLHVSSALLNQSIDQTTGATTVFGPGRHFVIFTAAKRRDTVWTGTSYPSILKHVPGKEKWEQLRLTPHIIPQVVFSNPKTNHFLVGTLRDGIFRWEEATNKLTPILQGTGNSAITVWHLFSNENEIWAATTRGIYILDSQTEEVIRHVSTQNSELPYDEILHIAKDEEGIYWLGTKGGGLIRWDVQNDSFRQFTVKTGLSNNTVYAVYPDEFGKLWLPSNYGLMCFDRKKFETIVYTVQNGIPHEEFNTFSHYQAENGTLYFGGLGGVMKFHPKDLQTIRDKNHPLYLLNSEVLAADDPVWKNKTDDFQSQNAITLLPEDRVLNLDVTLLNYDRPDENRYAYRIEGFQNNWIYTTGNRISISKPAYGNYILQIKGRGASGNWSEQILSLPLYVRKPFYYQTWFFLFSAFAVSALVFIGVKWRLKRLEERQKHLELEVKNRTAIIEKDKATILEQAESLKELDKNKTRFFSNIAHEIRTPLTLITGPILQLIEEQPPQSRLQKRLSGIYANAHQLLSMTNQLLDISKLENGKLESKFSYGDLAAYTRDLVGRFEAAAENKNVDLKNIDESKVWETVFDADQWNKIVHNLLSNALKFTDNGGRIEVVLSDFKKDSKTYISLLVKDSGIGMTEQQVDKVFDRFYQADSSSTRERGGSGIGLSLVKELVDLQKGKIYVSSKIGVGTEFRVLLPAEAELESEAAPFSNLNQPVPNTPVVEEKEVLSNHFASMKSEEERLNILIVEDNDQMRAYIKSCLDKKYNILEAADGEAGLETALSEQPDLIISDVMMPKKDGYELTKALRSDLITSHIPIILLTAKISNESRLEGLTIGADDYLTKPFNARELMLKIENFLKLRQRIHHRYANPDQFPQKSELLSLEDEFIAKIEEFILENIETTKLNGDVVGKHIGMSRVHLHRKLKAITGQPITEFVKEIRLKKAMELIQTRRWNVSEITDKTGFSSISYFSRSFKEAYGKAPSEVLKNYSITNDKT